jgi:hypothetical protein
MSLFDSIKKHLNDNYFGTIECTHCKKQGRVASFKKSCDGVRYCPDCIEILKDNNQLNLETADSELLEKYLNYYDYSKKELEPQFHEDFDYAYSCQVDVTNRLIKFNNWILEMDNLKFFAILFRPTEEADGIIKTSVYGNVDLLASLNSPELAFECCIEGFVKGKVKKKILSGELEYRDPPKLEKFKSRLDEVMKNS